MDERSSAWKKQERGVKKKVKLNLMSESVYIIGRHKKIGSLKKRMRWRSPPSNFSFFFFLSIFIVPLSWRWRTQREVKKNARERREKKKFLRRQERKESVAWNNHNGLCCVYATKGSDFWLPSCTYTAHSSSSIRQQEREMKEKERKKWGTLVKWIFNNIMTSSSFFCSVAYFFFSFNHNGLFYNAYTLVSIRIEWIEGCWCFFFTHKKKRKIAKIFLCNERMRVKKKGQKFIDWFLYFYFNRTRV